MNIRPSRPAGPALRAALAAVLFWFFGAGFASGGARQSSGQQPSTKKSIETTTQALRIPRQQAQNTAALDGIVRDSGFSNITVPVSGAVLTLRNLQTNETYSGTASGEGVFRIFPIKAGHYELRVSARDYGAFVISDLVFQPNEVVTLEISLVTAAAIEARSRLPRQPELGCSPSS